ncbi:MAG: hypothetical protein ABIY63_13365 [Fibrobacteria bacterium]
MRTYPDSRSFSQDYFDYPKGENAVDTLLKMTALKGYAARLENMEYQQSTLMRRAPFVEKSTQDFSAEGVFQGGYEYTAADDSQYILTGHDSGKVKRFVSAAVSTNVITGLTASRRIRFEAMNGACFVCNSENENRRIDGTAARLAGVPSPLGIVSIVKVAGALTGRYLWVVIPCIKFGGVVILRGDWSTILEATMAAENAQLSWAASTDTRTTGGYSVVYEVYRSYADVGEPFYLVAESAVASYTDSKADDALSGTTAPPLAMNGVMPIFKAMTASGYRLVGVKASDPKTLALSNIAVTDTDMEGFPKDGRHEIIAPGNGPVTGIIGFGVKDELDNSLDLFFSQLGSCYLLRGTDPFGSPETVSAQKGVVNFEAVCQHGQYLFFMSNQQQIEFYGPYGLRTISGKVDSYFKGGGPRNLGGLQGNQYVQLTVWQNYLLVIFRDDSAQTWGNRALVLDLEAFDVQNPKDTARWTPWSGPGFGLFIPCRNGELILLDNQNKRMLARGAGAYDAIAGVDTKIDAYLWSGAILGEYITNWKSIMGLNILSISDADAEGLLEADYGAVPESFAIVQNAGGRVWDKPWDKAWNVLTQWSAFVAISRDMVGRLFQLKIRVFNTSRQFVYIGASVNFDQVENSALCER